VNEHSYFGDGAPQDLGVRKAIGGAPRRRAIAFLLEAVVLNAVGAPSAF